MKSVNKYNFWSAVKRGAPGVCWPWLKCTQYGYGITGIRGRNYKAHRVAWFLTHGRIPKGLLVCHKCDNRICCNPNHMFVGTEKDNIQDMVSKRRGPHGVNTHCSKLNDKLVKWILCNKGIIAQRTMARKLGVSQKAVFNILHGYTWKHVK